MSVCSVVIMGANGRMGATLARLAREDSELTLAGVVERPGHEQGLEAHGCVHGDSLEQVLDGLGDAVVIDFTAPEASVVTAKTVAKTGHRAVIGTTGMTREQTEELREAAKAAPVLWAPNMSVGVNVLLRILPQLVALLGPAYDLELMEIHHKAKKDAPSGTAVKLAQCLAEAKGWEYDTVKQCCREGIIGARPAEEIGVQTLRGGDVVGDHTVYFFGPGERIEITHRAHSRETFAQGALRAAKWLSGQQPGKLYAIADMLDTAL
ncbi:4-hydroxy-tetrahydrodipicolinate reductase [Desulfonatronum lacustre]|uniref:4-hydroxy-tetrahydrodipicolinate reductase n=1 Tax=Desulfonatronum lacustre TaxID=66849 RepID=UPI000490DB25|nr:4-hydroxy-tetrahydrodipicolinate reductase [Desulfonatronum lacustre]